MVLIGEELVIDTGSGSCKAGFASENSHRVTIPCIVGRLKHRAVMHERSSSSPLFVGDDAQIRRGILTLIYPMEHGVIKNWDYMEQIWNHLLVHELRVNPNDHRVMLSEPPLNPKANKEKMGEIWFEKFCAPELHIAIQAVLSLYASGKTTGVSVDIGDGVCHVVPIYEGYSSSRMINRADIAGRDITSYLSCLLKGKGYYFNTSGEKEIVRNMKESLCEVMSFQESMEYQHNRTLSVEPANFTLPDGQVITICEERKEAPEMLFYPGNGGYECMGIQSCINNSILKCDIDLRRELYENISLSGGSTLFPGFPQRILDEISELAAPNIQVKIYAPSNRRSSVWLGGAILASLSSFQPLWVTQREYHEYGSRILHQKCV